MAHAVLRTDARTKVLLLRAERRAATVSATTAAPAAVSSVEMTSPNG